MQSTVNALDHLKPFYRENILTLPKNCRLSKIWW